MALYQQHSEVEKYLAQCAALAPITLRQNIDLYLSNRATFLGLNRTGITATQSTGLSLRERIEAHGTDLVRALTVNGLHKKFIEDRISEVIQALGGWDAIEPSAEWGFLLNGALNTTVAEKVFTLPSIPFEIQQGNKKFSVNIIPQQDGSGKVEFMLIEESALPNPEPI